MSPSAIRTESTNLPMSQVVDTLEPLLQNPAIAKYAHNANYDLTVLAEAWPGRVAGDLRHHDRRVADQPRQPQPGPQEPGLERAWA